MRQKQPFLKNATDWFVVWIRKSCDIFERFKYWSFHIHDRKYCITDRFGSAIAGMGTDYLCPPGIINLFNHFMYEKVNLLRTWCNDAVVILIVVRVVLSYPVLLLRVFPVTIQSFSFCSVDLY